jgi:hypothetical protein
MQSACENEFFQKNLNSRPAGNRILNVDLFRYIPETIELRLQSILHVSLY